MILIQVRNSQELSDKAASYLIKKVQAHPHAVLGLATGSTPKGTYKKMIEDHRQNGTSYKAIKTINLDEYVGLPIENRNSYHSFMKEQLFSQLNFSEGNNFLPNGAASNLEEACLNYDEIITNHQIDIQILGIGNNGHIGFNEPGTSFETKTHIVKLAQSTRTANARFFNSINEVPTHAMTMGIASILESKEILLLASGISKAKAVQQLLNGEVDKEFPASALHLHDHVTMIADQKALSLVTEHKRRMK